MEVIQFDNADLFYGRKRPSVCT